MVSNKSVCMYMDVYALGDVVALRNLGLLLCADFGKGNFSGS